MEIANTETDQQPAQLPGEILARISALRGTEPSAVDLPNAFR
jgi:hypothetical protein